MLSCGFEPYLTATFDIAQKASAHMDDGSVFARFAVPEAVKPGTARTKANL